MTDEIKDDTQQEPEQPQAEQGKEKIVEITISLPEPLKMSHWNCYIAAKNQYYVEERKADRIPDETTARLHGAAALIKAEYVSITGLDELRELREYSEHVDLTIAGLALDYIAYPIEARINAPLSGLVRRLSGTTATINGTSVQKR